MKILTTDQQLIEVWYQQAKMLAKIYEIPVEQIELQKWILFNLLMSKQFSKHRISQAKLTGVETWSPGDYAEVNNFMKIPKQPRRVTQQQFMTTEHEYEQSNKQASQSKEQQKEKPKPHRRRASQVQKPDLQFAPEDEDSEPLFYNPQFKSYNATPKLKRNQSNNIIDSSKEIEQRFKEIQYIMGNENENLRQQKDYLLRTIYKLQVKQKQYKNEIAQYRDKTLELEQQNRILRQKYEKARDFIANGIGKMQQAISKQATQSNFNNISNSNTAHHSNDSSVNISQQIEQLNDKFDVLMYEYQKTREPEIRKNCMEIAKELRKLRKMQDNQKGNHNK